MRFLFFWREGRGRAGVLPEKRWGTGGVLAHVPSGADSRPGEDAAQGDRANSAELLMSSPPCPLSSGR